MFPAFPAHAHPAILRIWQEAHGNVSSGWVLESAACHPDDMMEHQVIMWYKEVSISRWVNLIHDGISSGWLIANTLWHPDDTECFWKSSRWLRFWWYLIKMTFGCCNMSSGWHIMTPLLTWMTSRNFSKSSWSLSLDVRGPDEFRSIHLDIWMTYRTTCISSGWDNRYFKFSQLVVARRCFHKYGPL